MAIVNYIFFEKKLLSLQPFRHLIRLTDRMKKLKQDMKKLFLILAMAAALTAPVQAQKSLYRHNPQVVNNHAAADTSEVVAYSDTTGTSPDTAMVQPTAQDDNDSDNVTTLDDVSDPFTLIAYLANLGGFGGVVVAIAFVLLSLIIVLSPFIFIALIIYMVLKNRNKRYRLAEKAMESGQPIPDYLLKKDDFSNEVLWKNGIKNACLGIGLVVCFYIIGANPLTGIGWLVFFYGLGQCIISRTTGRDKRMKDSDNYVDDIKDESADNKEK